MPSFVEIGPMVLEKKVFRFRLFLVQNMTEFGSVVQDEKMKL